MHWDAYVGQRQISVIDMLISGIFTVLNLTDFGSDGSSEMCLGRDERR